MKEHYIKQVKRELLISRRQKNDVLRDLDEVFTSAMEHGETEQQVIERLGSPKDFAQIAITSWTPRGKNLGHGWSRRIYP